MAYELNVEGARLARQLCDEFTAANPAKPRFCAGVLGPTSRTLSISPDVNDPGFRNISFDALVDDYYDSPRASLEGGADILLTRPSSTPSTPRPRCSPSRSCLPILKGVCR